MNILFLYLCCSPVGEVRSEKVNCWYLRVCFTAWEHCYLSIQTASSPTSFQSVYIDCQLSQLCLSIYLDCQLTNQLSIYLHRLLALSIAVYLSIYLGCSRAALYIYTASSLNSYLSIYLDCQLAQQLSIYLSKQRWRERRKGR